MSHEPRPIGGEMSDVVLGVVQRLRLRRLERHYDRTLVVGAFALTNGCISIALMSLVAFATGAPFVFPSLGPTAFLLYYAPVAPSSSPRNTLLGHLIGVLSGYFAIAVFGLVNAGPALATGVTLDRVGAAALSLGLTAGLMVWLRVPHPPAGATTLIVSLGILTKPPQLAVLMLGVLLLVTQAIVINRLAGLDYPFWGPPPSARPRVG